MKFSISVIIPAYNVERFIEKAIQSASKQSHVAEVIVVEDGSADNTKAILEKLLTGNPKLKVFHHENNVNKGRSASRNLGIKKATEDFIAFLDADDFYLENRFVNDKELFKSNSNVDGIYNAISVHFYREANILEKDRLKLTTVRKKVIPEELFEALLNGGFGHFHIDGLTLKKSIFNKVGYFNEDLSVAEDTDLFWKMALKSCLIGGVIDTPVAVRGVHDSNVFNKEDLYYKYRIKLYESLIFWSNKNQVSLERIDLLLKWIWLIKYKDEDSLFKNISYWFFLFFNNSRILFSTLSIKYFPLIRLRKKMLPFLFP
ncbi:glycosyltransferase family A protein [Flavivirga abyssicola]|uniref:glycosyltransferase family 2 protein n=1 Tax=Flavivirga abyssicola TaxID=3063533 RepID=UPI0026DF64AA|nr:glycosyltransferase family A protein [Flavivirga sp. MEBiC07777]WVK13645.1 glycosyltransferase family A protein [Flavivirga sp. MEBiC07777]